jgi:long-chain fatty acid transport protein
MKGIAVTAGVLMVASTAATAGGVEKSNQSVAILFEEGSYAQLSFGSFSPDVSGTTLAPVGPFIPGFNSGNMAGRTTSLSFGYKQALSDRMDLAIIVDEPIGAKVRYPGTFGLSPYPLAGTTADLTSDAITALLRYKMQNNVSVYGGLRYQTVKGVVSIPFVGAPGPGYTLTTNNDGEFGYVVGVAWERPEIAARVALTYNAAITHTLDSVEGGPVPGTGSFETEVPQSVNLEFQTGIAQDTLLFGSIRWVDWSAFQIAPTGYGLAVGSPLVSYPNDRITYNLGIGRRFSETWAGAVTFAYEPADGEVTGNLGPTDGFASVGVAATYTMDNIKITGGVNYVDIGDALTTIGADFSGNHGIGAGVRIGYSF